MSKSSFNKSLSIDWSESIGHDCRISISDWDSGLLVTGYDEGNPQPLSLLDIGDWIFNIEDPAIQRWRETLPREVNNSLSLLPSYQAQILRWAVDSQPVVDLLISNPLLLWLLVDDGLLGLSSLGEINRKLGVKQKVLCADLGLTGTEQQVGIIRRAAGGNLFASAIRDLREILANQAICKFLGHRRNISGSNILVIKRYPWIVRYPCRALVDSLENADTLRIFQDVMRMSDDPGPLCQCRSPAAMQRLHDRLVEHINRQDEFNFHRDDWGDIKELPPPPLPGNESIKPVTTQQQIVNEGREMKHCIASFVELVLSGEFYVYQMLEPERLTIGLTISQPLLHGEASRYRLREVRGKYNHYPTEASMRLIEDWFESAQTHEKRNENSDEGAR